MFGQNTTLGGDYFAKIGDSESSPNVTIAYNFQGIGLPWYEWE
jgi:hypothetical protein